MLLNLYAATAEQKLEKLLSGVNLHAGLTPSLLLEEIKSLGAGIVTDDALLRKIWIQKLPITVRTHIASDEHKGLNLDQTVKLADLIHRIVAPTEQTIAALAKQQPVTANHTPPNDASIIANLGAAVAALTLEVSELKKIVHEKSRSRSPARSRSQSYCRRDSRSSSRSCSPYKFKPRRSRYVKNELCTFHFRYGDKAYRCIEGCKHYKPRDSSEKLISRLVVATVGQSQEHRNSPRLSVRDRNSGLIFLVDSGAEISSIPHTFCSKPETEVKYPVTAANGTEIRTFGLHGFTLNLGFPKQQTWNFLVTDLKQPIIGADFLKYYDLLPDLRRKRLVQGETMCSTPAKIKYNNVPTILLCKRTEHRDGKI